MKTTQKGLNTKVFTTTPNETEIRLVLRDMGFPRDIVMSTKLEELIRETLPGLHERFSTLIVEDDFNLGDSYWLRCCIQTNEDFFDRFSAAAKLAGEKGYDLVMHQDPTFPDGSRPDPYYCLYRAGESKTSEPEVATIDFAEMEWRIEKALPAAEVPHREDFRRGTIVGNALDALRRRPARILREELERVTPQLPRCDAVKGLAKEIVDEMPPERQERVEVELEPDIDDPTRALVTDRGKLYGAPEDNHSVTADFFTVWLARKYGDKGLRRLDSEDVAVFNILQKISRAANAFKDDNWADVQGYALNARDVGRDGRSVGIAPAGYRSPITPPNVALVRQAFSRGMQLGQRMANASVPYPTLINFAAWLTTEDHKIVAGAHFDAAPMVEALKRYVEEKGIKTP